MESNMENVRFTKKSFTNELQKNVSRCRSLLNDNIGGQDQAFAQGELAAIRHIDLEFGLGIFSHEHKNRKFTKSAVCEFARASATFVKFPDSGGLIPSLNYAFYRFMADLVQETQVGFESRFHGRP
jgi:hypothetical protein